MGGLLFFETPGYSYNCADFVYIIFLNSIFAVFLAL